MNSSAAFASVLVWAFLSWFSAPGGAAAAPAENPWASLLRRDVEAMHRVLVENHPGTVDTLNKGFSHWLEAGYRQVPDRAQSCNSYEGYRFGLEAHAFGFKDGHLGVATELRRDGVHWPGFMVGWQPEGGKGGGKLVVRVVAEGNSGDGLPPIGGEVISCDGKTPRALHSLIRRCSSRRAETSSGVATTVASPSSPTSWPITTRPSISA